MDKQRLVEIAEAAVTAAVVCVHESGFARFCSPSDFCRRNGRCGGQHVHLVAWARQIDEEASEPLTLGVGLGEGEKTAPGGAQEPDGADLAWRESVERRLDELVLKVETLLERPPMRSTAPTWTIEALPPEAAAQIERRSEELRTDMNAALQQRVAMKYPNPAGGEVEGSVEREVLDPTGFDPSD